MPPGTRDALIDAATRLLDQGGVEAVTLREVGRLAGVSHNAPYKYFPSKEALLAAIAARELTARRDALDATSRRGLAPEAVVRSVMRQYIAWVLAHPARFKLIYGKWSIDSAELGEAAHAAQEKLVEIVAAAQDAEALPPGDPVRLAALIRALAHGAADLAAADHLAAGGKGHADPEDLVDDLLGYLRPGVPGRA